MHETENQLPVIGRLPSGVAGLDTILRGGFFKGGLYLIMGPPGAGKTILGNQLCFNHVAAGGRAIYITLLAETHSRMLAHMQSLAFYDPAPITDTLYYINAYSILEQEGLNGLTALLRQEIRARRASILVIDGVSTVEQTAANVREWKQFLHDLHVSAEINRCTTFLQMQYDQGPISLPIHTMVDGLVEISTRLLDMRMVRELQIRKFRGSGFMEGKHLFAITNEGLVIHPRIEAIFSPDQVEHSTSLTSQDEPMSMGMGVTALDEMLQGGLPAGSTTMLLGSSGTGKTMLGLHFLYEGARQGQKGLCFGFYETPAQLVRKMRRIGLHVDPLLADGTLDVLWQPPVQDIPDILAERLLATIRERNIQRLFIDGIGGFQRTVATPARLDLFMTALITTLRMLDLTTICTVELPDLFSPGVTVPVSMTGTISLAENILFLRHVELHSRLYRLISILKMRERGYDPSIRELRITDQGIEVAPTFTSVEAIFTGVAHPSSVNTSSIIKRQTPAAEGQPL